MPSPRPAVQEFVDANKLEYALGSPLRLRLIAELLSDGELGLDELVVRSGRHRQDVLACLRPLEPWGVVSSRQGGQAFRLVPNMPSALLRTLERVVEQRAGQLELERRVRHQVLAGMIGVDAKMQLVFEMIRQVARLDVPVLITGETGTGKELVARATHDLSPRSNGFFGAVNCATLTEELFASEIFGHAKGAFTGAVRDHAGLVERCHGGTLFLDEVGDLSLANQVKLLRVLQESTFTRVGDERVRKSDFRLISATNRDLKAMVGEGTFREDLYYRLNVFPVRLPSLRERVADLPYLIDEILRNQTKRLGEGTSILSLTPGALERLGAHHWPGNVRELENVVTRAAIMAMGGPIRAEHLPELPGVGGGGQNGRTHTAGEVLISLAEVEGTHIRRVLSALQGNMRASARVLGISRTTLYKKVKDYAIEVLELVAASA